jgi:hypothetical protein
MRYEPLAINFHLGETPPREPQGGGEQTSASCFVVPQFERDPILVALDRQSDHQQGGEERQDSDVESEPQRRVGFLRRAVEGAEDAQADTDQVDEAGGEHAQAKDHGDLGCHLPGLGHHARGPDQEQEDNDGGHPQDE